MVAANIPAKQSAVHSRVMIFLLRILTTFMLGTSAIPAQAQLNKAEFVRQSVPMSMQAGTSYTVSVTMKNTGTSTWTPGQAHALGPQSPQENRRWVTARVAVNGPIAPGQEQTFTFVVVAPDNAGTYDFQWGMLQEGLEWFGQPSTKLTIAVTGPSLVNAAEFVTQSAPVPLATGQTQLVSVTMRNTGTTTWRPDRFYRLGSQSPPDNKLWTGFNRITLNAVVIPGQTHTFNFNVAAPPTAGRYDFQWRMVRDFVEWFGAISPNAPVTVSGTTLLNGAEFVSQVVPANMTPRRLYDVSVTMKNTGTSTWSPAREYRLGAQNPRDNTVWSSSNRVALTATVAPGQQHQFRFTVLAPATPGTHAFQWQMVQDGVAWFGWPSSNLHLVVVPMSASYTSDSLARLRRATYTNGTVVTYDFDAAGNRITHTTSGATN